MPRQYRLSRAQFELLQKIKHRRIHGKQFSLLFYPEPAVIKGPKVGIVIPKKLAARANVRNTIERRTREVLRKLIQGDPRDAIYILHGKKGISEASFDELKQDLTSLFEQTR